MNTKQACEILEISIGASEEEVKKAFRSKAARLHPDINKEPDAEQKFKELNEAYQFVEKHGTTEIHQQGFTGRSINDMFNIRFNDNFNIFFGGNQVNIGSNPFYSQQIHPITVSIEIPFELSITGGKKEITYERQVPCNDCNLNSNKCETCKGTKIISSVVTVEINIPPGLQNGSRLVLKDMGHFRNGRRGVVYCNVIIIKDREMILQGNDVISIVELSLLEALVGTKKKLRTVKGDKTLVFKPMTRNKDSIRVSGFGVPPNGCHIFIIDVKYPEDVSKLIEVLKDQSENVPDEISGEQN